MREFKGTTGKWNITITDRYYKLSSEWWQGFAKFHRGDGILNKRELNNKALANVVMASAAKDLYNACVLMMNAADCDSFDTAYSAMETACEKATTVPEEWKL